MKIVLCKFYTTTRHPYFRPKCHFGLKPPLDATVQERIARNMNPLRPVKIRWKDEL